MNITRTIPDVRSTNIDKTVRFYTELLGFDARTEDGHVVSFVSASHDGVEVTLNRDRFALPPGFTVEVETEAAERPIGRQRRMCASSSPGSAEFSVLDPAGRRVTITAAHPKPDRPRRPVTQPDRSCGDTRIGHRARGGEALLRRLPRLPGTGRVVDTRRDHVRVAWPWAHRCLRGSA